MAQELVKHQSAKPILTFEQICPLWGQVLSRKLPSKDIGRILDASFLDIASSEFCVVGEAWKFTRKYCEYDTDTWCDTCDSFSGHFYSYILDIDKIETLKEKFTKHWNTCHR